MTAVYNYAAPTAVSITSASVERGSLVHRITVATDHAAAVDVVVAFAEELAARGELTLPTLVPADGWVPERWTATLTFVGGSYAGETEDGGWSGEHAREDAHRAVLSAAGYTVGMGL